MQSLLWEKSFSQMACYADALLRPPFVALPKGVRSDLHQTDQTLCELPWCEPGDGLTCGIRIAYLASLFVASSQHRNLTHRNTPRVFSGLVSLLVAIYFTNCYPYRKCHRLFASQEPCPPCRTPLWVCLVATF